MTSAGSWTLCPDDPEELDLLDRVTVGKQGERTDLVYNVNEVEEKEERPSGNSRQRALRRLRKSRPDLHERVLRKELSAHAAMKKAGFVKVATVLDVMTKVWARARETTMRGSPCEPCSSA
jgi:hypothetical protein